MAISMIFPITRENNMHIIIRLRYLILFFLILLLIPSAFAANRTVNLVVAYKTVHFAGKSRRAIAVNDQIPAPTLHFKEGDHVTINVINHLPIGTVIHWHGLLVPWQMDGVEGITQHAIPPGKSFSYQFTLYQAGTYWYHAHAGFQEQEGLYGAFIIHPPHAPPYKYTKEYAVVLSDWINTQADQVFANLKKEGDYYSPRFPLQPSLLKFMHDYRRGTGDRRQQLVMDYKMMQQMRMSIYDISDVAYDAFLLNGHPASQPWTALVKVGDIVRLRFVGAGGNTIFHVKIPGTVMKVVQVQGNEVRPYLVEDFTIAPGETYDVLVKIQKPAPYVIYAESADTVGAAKGALITDLQQPVDYQVQPFPEPPPVGMMGMGHDMNMPGMSHGAMNMGHDMKMSGMNHSAMAMDHGAMNPMQGMNMPMAAQEPKTTGTKYQDLVAAVKTNNPNKPIQAVIHMDLNGWMDSYIWFINGVPEYRAKPIIFEPGKRYRIVFVNNSMMRHPMHIHGHWFILRNGHGAHDPLLHTIDMAPGSTAVADIDADASGQWFFHCHLLYHMFSGMARVFQYSTIIDIIHGQASPQREISHEPYANRPIVREDALLPIEAALIKHPMAHPHGFYWANFLDFGQDPFQNAQRATFRGLYGPDVNKLQLLMEDAEMNQGRVEDADLDIFYWHQFSQFWAVKGGVNYFFRPAETAYVQPGVGIEGLMPYFIETDIRSYYYDGSVKLDVELSRDSQISNNFFIRAGLRSILASETVNRAAIGNGLNQMRYIIRPYYRFKPGWSVFAEFEHEDDYGAFRNIISNEGESTTENTVTLGLTVVF